MRQLGHLVEEDRAAVGLLEIALAGLGGAGEGPLLVAEKLGIDGSLGYGRTIDGDVLVVLARRIGVNDLRKKLLAHTALARDEDRQVRRRHTQGNLQRPVQKFRGSDDAEALFNTCYFCHGSGRKVDTKGCIAGQARRRSGSGASKPRQAVPSADVCSPAAASPPSAGASAGSV